MNELRAYADGSWPDFGGVDACGLAEVEAQLGPRRSEQLHGGVFGGEPTQFAVYPGAAAPSGVTADMIAVSFGLKPFDPDVWESDPLHRWRSERRLSP